MFDVHSCLQGTWDRKRHEILRIFLLTLYPYKPARHRELYVCFFELTFYELLLKVGAHLDTLLVFLGGAFS